MPNLNYANPQAIIDAMSTRIFEILDVPVEDEPSAPEDMEDDTRVLSACSAANDQIDNTLRARYGDLLPITSNNGDLIRHAVNLAVYLLIVKYKKGALSDFDRLQYEDAVAYLKDAAKGLITFVFPPVNKFETLGVATTFNFGSALCPTENKGASSQGWFNNH